MIDVFTSFNLDGAFLFTQAISFDQEFDIVAMIENS